MNKIKIPINTNEDCNNDYNIEEKEYNVIPKEIEKGNESDGSFSGGSFKKKYFIIYDDNGIYIYFDLSFAKKIDYQTKKIINEMKITKQVWDIIYNGNHISPKLISFDCRKRNKFHIILENINIKPYIQFSHEENLNVLNIYEVYKSICPLLIEFSNKSRPYDNILFNNIKDIYIRFYDEYYTGNRYDRQNKVKFYTYFFSPKLIKYQLEFWYIYVSWFFDVFFKYLNQLHKKGIFHKDLYVNNVFLDVDIYNKKLNSVKFIDFGDALNDPTIPPTQYMKTELSDRGEGHNYYFQFFSFTINNRFINCLYSPLNKDNKTYQKTIINPYRNFLIKKYNQANGIPLNDPEGYFSELPKKKRKLFLR
jgi:hypothetical protein